MLSRETAELAPDRGLDVIYDGRCGFCIRSLSLVRRLARRNVFRFHDANRPVEVLARFPALAGADMDEAMFAVAPDGRVSRGFFAFRRMMWAGPWLYPLLVLFYLPGASVVGPAVYAWVARHRHRFGCASACALDDPARTAGRAGE